MLVNNMFLKYLGGSVQMAALYFEMYQKFSGLMDG